MSNAATITRNSFWNLLDMAVGMGGSFVTSVVVARVMGPAKLGYYQYVLWVASFAGLIAALGVPAATLKYVAEHLGRGDHATGRAIIRATLRFQAGMATAVGVIGLVVVLLRVPPEHRLWASVAVLSLVPQMLYGVPTSAIAATEDLRLNVRASVIASTLNVLGVAVALFMKWDLLGLTGALLLSRLCDCALRFYFYRQIYDALPARGVRVKLPPDLKKLIVRFGWQSTILLALDMMVWNRSEILFLQHYCHITQVTFFSIGFNVLDNLLVLPRALAWSAETTMMVQQGRGPERVAMLGVNTMRFTALFSIPAAFGLAALSGAAVSLVYGTQYLPAIPILTITALLSLGRALQLPAQQLLITTDNQGFLVRWGLLLTVLSVGINFLVIPTSGAMGAALSKGGVQTIAMIGMWVFASRRLGAKVPLGKLTGLFLASALMFGVVWTVSRLLPGSVPDLLVGIPLGGVLVVALLRAVRFLDASDRGRLAPLARKLPGRLRPAFEWVVRFVTPEAPSATVTPTGQL